MVHKTTCHVKGDNKEQNYSSFLILSLQWSIQEWISWFLIAKVQPWWRLTFKSKQRQSKNNSIYLFIKRANLVVAIQRYLTRSWKYNSNVITGSHHLWGSFIKRLSNVKARKGLNTLPGVWQKSKVFQTVLWFLVGWPWFPLSFINFFFSLF